MRLINKKSNLKKLNWYDKSTDEEDRLSIFYWNKPNPNITKKGGGVRKATTIHSLYEQILKSFIWPQINPKQVKHFRKKAPTPMQL